MCYRCPICEKILECAYAAHSGKLCGEIPENIPIGTEYCKECS